MMRYLKYSLPFFLLTISLCVFSQKGVKKGEVLYNGIQLPTQWPPANVDLNSDTPLKAPYMDEIPKVIDISVGRQLFVDDFLIEYSTLERKYHQAVKYKGNPIIYPTMSYEKNSGVGKNRDVTYLGHGGVFYDPLDNLYKMYYTAGWRGGLALAISKDLLIWEKPQLNENGSNILIRGGAKYAGEDNSVWLDIDAVKPTERLKYLTDRRTNDSISGRHSLMVSDGTHWSQPIQVNTNQGDYSSFFYNPFRRKWVFSIKKSDTGTRSRLYLETDKFLDGWDWKKSVAWTRTDSLDKPDPHIGDKPQLYSLNAVAYESIMLGEFYIHLGPKNEICNASKEPKITELKMGFSRDGFHWYRPDREAFISASRENGSWDKGYIHGTTGVCVVKGDSLYFPYTGFSGQATDGTKGMYTGASIGLATLRRDGFASLDAKDEEGVVISRILKFQGKYLFVNVNSAKGSLRAEILDENNQVISGYEVQSCFPIRADKTLERVEWSDRKDLSDLSGKKIKVKFYLENGALYSFWISPDFNGASYGYQGAGSAGLDGVIDDKGLLNY